jgi:signal transduction histidine kinase
VLGVARSERMGLPLHRQPVDLAALARRVVQADGQAAGERQVEVHVSSGPGVLQVSADPDHMESVVRNLLDNAERYGEPGQPVDIQVSSDHGVVRLSVADRGPGVPAHERKRIFRPFFRGELGLSQAKAGAGLGLALVQRIVAAHGGTVAVKPRAGGGSVFTVVLPAAGGAGVESDG